jgi:hypothetical protein
MALRLSPEDEDFRRNVVGLGGNLEAIARIYRVTPSAISHRLWSERHSEWWSAFKRRRSRRRRAARQQRYRERCRRLRDGTWEPVPGAASVEGPDDRLTHVLLEALLQPCIPAGVEDAADEDCPPIGSDAGVA